MLLGVSPVARLFGVPESTVRGWIAEDGLPAQRLGDDLVLRKALLFDWASTRRLKVPPSLFAAVPGDLAAALRRGSLETGAIGDAVAPRVPAADREGVRAALSPRAFAHVGEAVMVPLATAPVLVPGAPCVVRVRTPSGLVFVVLAPTVRQHQALLAGLVDALHHPPFARAVHTAGADELAALLPRVTPFALALGVWLAGGLVATGVRPNVVGPAVAVLGAVLALVPTVGVLASGVPLAVAGDWSVPNGAWRVELDPLSAWFLVPTLVVGALAAVYGGSYLKGRTGVAWLAYDVLLAAMATVLVARSALLFLVAWEAMSLASWALVTFEHERAEVRRAGWIYLVATHFGTAFLLAYFLLAGHASGGALLGLAIVGFGAKAGIVPLHVWLPEAHAAAPSHVSALMSAVLVKMGVYGILRALTNGTPTWAGPLLVALGVAGALLGIRQALGARDSKRVLAFSTVENVGLVLLGAGVGAWGSARGQPAIAALGYGAALVHVWNHALMKGLLFLGAGSVLHGTGSKDLERLGGVLRAMPWTGSLLLLGGVAIAGLPPLNGFASEWLLALGLVHGGVAFPGSEGTLFLLALGALALAGAMAAAAFGRAIGIAVLGTPRAPLVAHEAPRGMLVPMGLLAAGCVALGLVPQVPVRIAGRVLAELGAPPVALDLAPIGVMAAALYALVAVLATGLVVRVRGARIEDTWGCGYPSPTPRMQYTARSFTEIFAEGIFVRSLGAPGPSTEPFPGPAAYRGSDLDPLLSRVYEPLFGRAAERFAGLRRLQQGSLPAYLAYLGVAVVVALAWASLHTWRTS